MSDDNSFDDLPENRWYDQEDFLKPSVTEADKAKYKKVMVEDGEFRSWCKNWKNALVFNIMGTPGWVSALLKLSGIGCEPLMVLLQ